MSMQDNYTGVFPSRLRKLIEARGTTITALAKELKISRQAVSQYADGSAQPNIEKIALIARFFNVSSDYLIGLSDLEVVNIKTREICEKTGLSEASINRLMSAVKRKKTTWAAVINQFLLQPRILDALHAYLFIKVDSFAVIEDSKISDDRLGMIALVDDEAGRCAVMTPDMMDGAMQIEIQKELFDLKQQIKARRDNGAAKE